MAYRALFFALFLIPQIGFASVRINEVAWMGSATSPTDEWIELYNDGTTTVALNGWVLTTKDKSPSIALSGSIAPESYYLIERTDDETVPNVPADLVASFGKGLGNDGETLVLDDASGTPMDTVKGGTNWKSIGGDAKTHATAQRGTRGWFTAAPTPRSRNIEPAPVLTVKPAVIQTPTVKTETGVVAPKPEVMAEIVPKTLLTTTTEASPASSSPRRVLFSSTSDTPPSERSHVLLGGAVLVFLIMLGSLGALYVQSTGRSLADEFTIVDVTNEDELEQP